MVIRVTHLWLVGNRWLSLVSLRTSTVVVHVSSKVAAATLSPVCLCSIAVNLMVISRQ